MPLPRPVWLQERRLSKHCDLVSKIGDGRSSVVSLGSWNGGMKLTSSQQVNHRYPQQEANIGSADLCRTLGSTHVLRVRRTPNLRTLRSGQQFRSCFDPPYRA